MATSKILLYMYLNGNRKNNNDNSIMENESKKERDGNERKKGEEMN